MTTSSPVRRRLTDELLSDVSGSYRAVISPTEPGVVAGVEALRELLADGRFGEYVVLHTNGEEVQAHTPIVDIVGTAQQLAAAEDAVLGPIGYAGGIAQRCREIEAQRPDNLRVVCGGWKKLPGPLKPILREGLSTGGIAPRLIDGDFVYIDKNVVTLSGGIESAVAAALRLGNGPVAVQVTTPQAALAAVGAGAEIVMDDTGRLDMLGQIDAALQRRGFRDRVTLAFAGGVRIDDLAEVRRNGADVVDLGRAILDAPLWDVHMVVEP